MSPERVRVGIDVGGTFTHAVALALADGTLLASARVPTTHDAAEGVARGVVESLRLVLTAAGLTAAAVAHVAHSTTQATNALLEGDVACVGILAAGRGAEGRSTAAQTALPPFELAPGHSLSPLHRYVDLDGGGAVGSPAGDGSPLDPAALENALLDEAVALLVAEGAQAIVAAAAFSVDDPVIEEAIVAAAERAGVPATATCHLTGRYGLTLRTRTAAVNAAILPTMLETARRTDEAVRELGIEAPLVVMRSDGGAMDCAAMRRRPILTVLSGPAAGVAAAVMAARVADGVFVEVGGTSTDVTAIRGGRAQVRTARVGGHRLCLDTVDVRTVGVAGGSLPRMRDGRVEAVGPRSAHIAGLPYAAFPGSSAPDLSDLSPLLLAPRPGDAPVYAVLGRDGAPVLAVTPTCAAAALGELPDGEGADAAAAHAALDHLAADGDGLALARSILNAAARVVADTVLEAARDGGLDPATLTLVGGGGGASVLVPRAAALLGVSYRVVEHAGVIAAVGAALALLQETVERTLVDPGPEAVAAAAEEARLALVAQGADPDGIEVRVEVDRGRGLLRAVAVGAHLIDGTVRTLDESDLVAHAAALMRVEAAAVEVAFRLRGFLVATSLVTTSRLFGLLTSERRPYVVLDPRGRPRALAPDGRVRSCTRADLDPVARALWDECAAVGDAGVLLPPSVVVADGRVVDVGGLLTADQRLAVLNHDLDGLAPDAALVVCAERRR